MKKKEFSRSRVERRLIARAFFKRNGAFIAIALALCALGGLIAVMPFDRSEADPGAPAENSMDERLKDAQSSASPIPLPTRRPLPTLPPAGSAGLSPLPTVMPDMTPAPSKEPMPTSEAKLDSPVDGKLIKPYAMDCLIYSKTLNQWMTHSGVDIAAPIGAEVRAVAAGTVEWVTDDDLLGTCVLVDHGNGLKTLYCGLKKEPPVKDGDRLEPRALVGYVGDTAISECAEESHLHFEVIKDGLPTDPEGYVLIPKSE